MENRTLPRPESLEACRQLDERDPLAKARDAFQVPHGILYLDGNSLGCMPRAAPERLRRVVDHEWGEGLIRSWNTADWIGLPERLGAKIAPLVGADPGEVIVTDSTSVNLFKLAAAAMRMRPGRRTVITEPGNFPTDLYILQGLVDFMPEAPRLITCPIEEIPARLDDDTALVLLTHVHYKTGHVRPMRALTEAVQAAGALMLWDLSHSTGAMPLALSETGVDLAVGCGYKYLNGGPGAPAFLYVAERHQAELDQPIYGWFGHAEPFAMSDDYRPAPGIRRAITGTTPILGASALEVGLDVFETVSMNDIRFKSMALTQLMIDQVRRRCPASGFVLASPEAASDRGSQVAFRHPDAYAIIQAMIDRGVIGDFRAPDIMRFGMAPLYIGYRDVWNAVEALVEVMESGIWRATKYQQRSAVT